LSCVNLLPGRFSPLPLSAHVEAQLRNGAKERKKRIYPLRGAMRCAECGCLITAGTHQEHVYYRCTHGKSECSQKSYIREEKLMAEVESILGGLELTPEMVGALVEDCEKLLKEKSGELAQSLSIARSEVVAVRSREKTLLDAYLDSAVSVEVY